MLQLLSFNVYDVLAFLFFVTICYVTNYYYKYFTRPNPLPGPFPLPLIGNLYQFPGDFSIWLDNLQEKYGDMWEVYMGSKRQVFIGRAELVEKIFSASAKNNYPHRTLPNEGLDELGVSRTSLIFNRDLNDWRRNRSFISRVIMSPKFNRQFVPWMQNVFDDMDRYWCELGEDCVLEFSKWMQYFFVDATFLLMTNKRTYSLANYYNELSPNKKADIPESLLSDSKNFVEYLERDTRSIIYFINVPTIIRHLPGVNLYTRYLLKQRELMINYLKDLIKKRRNEIANTPEDQELSPDILTMLSISNTSRDFNTRKADNEHNEPMKEDSIIGILMAIIGGGVGTPSSSLCFIVHYLAHYPEVKKLVFQELDKVFGRDPNRKITYEDIQNLKYCEAVIKEVSRLIPVIPILIRVSSRPDEIGGINFPGNTQFGVNVHGIHMNKAHWNEPEKFDPNRFLTKDNNDQDVNAFFMFGGGLRICPAKNMATTEMKTMVALIYRKYDIELVDINAPIKYATSLTKNCSELKVRIRRRVF